MESMNITKHPRDRPFHILKKIISTIYPTQTLTNIGQEHDQKERIAASYQLAKLYLFEV
jgi:hypothetical protein